MYVLFSSLGRYGYNKEEKSMVGQTLEGISGDSPLYVLLVSMGENMTLKIFVGTMLRQKISRQVTSVKTCLFLPRLKNLSIHLQYVLAPKPNELFKLIQTVSVLSSPSTKSSYFSFLIS